MLVAWWCFGRLVKTPFVFCTPCYTRVLAGRRWGFQTRFGPSSNRESLKIGPEAGRNLTKGPMLMFSRLESCRIPARNPARFLARKTLLRNIGYNDLCIRSMQADCLAPCLEVNTSALKLAQKHMLNARMPMTGTISSRSSVCRLVISKTQSKSSARSRGRANLQATCGELLLNRIDGDGQLFENFVVAQLLPPLFHLHCHDVAAEWSHLRIDCILRLADDIG